MNPITLEQAKQHPSEFLYIFATDEFLQYIDARHRATIVGKRANQYKVLLLSAKHYNVTPETYTNAIRAGFIDIYDMTPAQALVTLAQGGEVAGKNWAKGVYGIGALKRSDFVQDPTISVDPVTGAILKSGVKVSNDSTAIYGRVKGAVTATNYSYNVDGKTYTSQLINGKYYAGQYSYGDLLQNADGKAISAADSSSIWESVLMWLDELWEKIVALFASDEEKEIRQITPENTVPQQSDGFVTEAGISSSTLFLALGATAIVASGAIPKFWNTAKRSRKSK